MIFVDAAIFMSRFLPSGPLNIYTDKKQVKTEHSRKSYSVCLFDILNASIGQN